MFFTPWILNVWNSLPSHVVNSSSVNRFKNNLDGFWSNREVYCNFGGEMRNIVELETEV